jgi:hypothetical protein
MEKKVTSVLTKGLIIALALFILDLVAGFANFKFATWFRWIPTVILFVAVLWACFSFASQNNNNVTFGNIFGHGFKTSAIIACLSIIFTMLSAFVIFPETKDIALEQARKSMEEKGNLTEDQISAGLEMTKRLFLPFLMLGVIFGTLIVGLVASLVGAAIAKKNPQTGLENQF